MLDVIGERITSGRVSLAAEVEQYLDSLRQSTAREIAASQARQEQIRAELRGYLAGFYRDDGPDEGHPTDPRHAQVEASAVGAPASARESERGEPNPQAAAGLTAAAIRDMPMAEYAARRAELGVRAPTSMTRLFGGLEP
jgi:hypothetical protein